MCHVDASLDPTGETLTLDPDVSPFLDRRDPAQTSSECTRGFPSGYHPALEYGRQGVDEVSELGSDLGRGGSVGAGRVRGGGYSISAWP